MSISIQCPGCDKSYKVKPEAAGKRFKCRQCGTSLVVPTRRSKTQKEVPNNRSNSPEFNYTPTRKPRKKPVYEDPDLRMPEYVEKKSWFGETFYWPILVLQWTGLIISGLIILVGLLYLTLKPFMKETQEDQNIAALQVVPAPADVPSQASFQKRRAALKTVLRSKGPSPQEYEELTPPEGIEEISYPSGDLNLKAWIDRRFAKKAKSPTFIFFHGGFGFDESAALTIGEEYAQTGYIFVYPMLRGENGNPGNFELFLGEVDDAKAICKWVSEQPDVDPAKIYAFGHSVGGGISALLSLLEDVPIRHSGSNGGLYNLDTFDEWADICPFYPEHLEERRVRVLVGNIADMKRDHYAFIGRADKSFDPAIIAAEKEMAFEALSKLTIKRVSGNHQESLTPALRTYIQYTQTLEK